MAPSAASPHPHSRAHPAVEVGAHEDDATNLLAAIDTMRRGELATDPITPREP